MIRRTLLPLLLALTLTATATAAAAPPHRTTLNAVEAEVMCVSCGVPLNIAESPQADRERALIQRLVNRGLTKDQVKAELVNELGPRVLAMPKDKGFGIAAYLVPLALALGGIALLVTLVPRWRRNRAGAAGSGTPGEPATAAATLSPADASRLDEDLARYEI